MTKTKFLDSLVINKDMKQTKCCEKEKAHVYKTKT